MEQGESHRLNFEFLQGATEEFEHHYDKSLPKAKRIVKRNFIRRNCGKSGWNTVGEGFKGLHEEKEASTLALEQKCEDKSPIKSQASINCYSSDDECSELDLQSVDKFGNVPTEAEICSACGENNDVLTSDTNQILSAKETVTRSKTSKGYLGKPRGIGGRGDLIADDVQHSVDINVIHSPNSKETEAAKIKHQRLKLVTSSGSEESIYVESHQEQNNACAISQYDSDSEKPENIPVKFLYTTEEESDNQVIPIEVEEISSANISQQSGQSRDENIADISKVKASDWARSVQNILDTEVESCDGAVGSNQAQISQFVCTSKDTGKTKESLADRVQRLVEREKFYYASWSQKPNAKTETDPQKILMVKVNRKEIKYSLLECQCSCLSPQAAVVDSSETREETKLKVLFHMELDKVIKLGSLIKIHPPWQKMSATKAGVLLLCTHYPEIIGYEPPAEYKTLREEDITWVEVARWQCPCQTDMSLDSKDCPAHLTPHIPHHSQVKSLEEESIDRNGSNTPGIVSVNPEVTESTAHCSILSSVENQGSSGVCFTALVQRVFCRLLATNKWFPQSNVKKDGVQYGLIVQDQRGTMCEIQLPERCTDHANEWKEIVSQGEGKVYHFAKLKIVQRANQAKHKALFTMLNFLWSGRQMDDRNSQISDTSPDSFQPTNSGPPSFCYILKCDIGTSRCMRLSVQLDTLYQHLSVVDYTPVNDESVEQRCSLLGKFLFQWEKPIKDGSDVSVLYLVNSKENFIPVFLKVNFFSPPNRIRNNNWIIMKDALIESGRIYLDGYSDILSSYEALEKKILATGQINKLDHLHPRIPDVDEASKLYDLVSLEGDIIGVDESTAYSWLACNMCNNDKLAGGTNQSLGFHCNRCNRTVGNPTTKMSLEIYLKLPSLENGKVKLKLCQENIQKLLPSNMTEGYDIECVLNRHIGPVAAVITSIEKNLGHSHLPRFCAHEVQIEMNS